MNKLERQQLQRKHNTPKQFDGWTNFTGELSSQRNQHGALSYRTKLQQRDNLKLEREGWK